MRRQWPARNPFSRSNNEQSFPRGCVPIVSATNDAFVHAVTKRAQSLEEGLVSFAGLRLERLAVCTDWAPANKFRNVLDDDVFDVEFLRPLNHTPCGDALLILDWPTTASNRVEGAFWRCD